MPSLSASPQGTESLRKRFASLEKNQFYRLAQGLTMSSLGIGTYLGPMDDDTDRAYTSAVRTAIRSGINVIDTSLNYRHQRSERAIGRAIETVIQAGDSARNELVVATKAGYLVPQAIPSELLQPGDVVANMHCLKPAFLEDQLRRSLINLRLQRVDIFYLHNPETQLQFLDPSEVYRRIGDAFATCEAMVAAGKISFYGVATWDGFRRRPGGSDGLQLPRLAEWAKRVGGAQHHFRFVQLPFNFAMPEAVSVRNQGEEINDAVPIVEAAHELGITVISSATLMQGRLTRDLPEAFLEKFSDSLPTQAQRAIQFARSTPGITTALIGMSKAERVAENLVVGKVKPFSAAEYYSFYGR
jgi:aryl-alcohol dehydrogenase-like predicted oxidoreductase